MSEPREIELKLEGELSDLATLQAHPLLQEAAVQEEALLTSVYHDTPDLSLHGAGLGLRVRKVGERYIQTLKAEGDGLFERPEWEWPVGGPEPDLALLADTPAAAILDGAPPPHPVFTTAVTRRSYGVEQGRSRIEVALDSGRIVAQADDRVVAICEVEVELKDGAAADVFALAHALAALAPLRLGVRSKSERGYLLAAGETDRVRKAEPVRLRPDMNAAQAFQAIAHACLRHMRINEDVLLQGRNVEALHQVRVAIRRLRSAFSLFGDLVGDAQAGRLRAELKRMTEPLGSARNLDVFLATTLPAARERHPDEPGLLTLETLLEDRRAQAHDAVQALLRSDAWRMLILDLVGWVNAGPWLRDEAAGRAELRAEPARVYAARVLDKRRRQVKKRGRHLDDLSAEERHRVRIAAKKLRYGAEFFAGLYAGKKASRRHTAFVKALSELQDHLGALNDIATADTILHDVLGGEAGPSALFAAGMTAADVEARSRALLKEAAAARSDLVDAKPFWR